MRRKLRVERHGNRFIGVEIDTVQLARARFHLVAVGVDHLAPDTIFIALFRVFELLFLQPVFAAAAVQRVARDMAQVVGALAHSGHGVFLSIIFLQEFGNGIKRNAPAIAVAGQRERGIFNRFVSLVDDIRAVIVPADITDQGGKRIVKLILLRLRQRRRTLR